MTVKKQYAVIGLGRFGMSLCRSLHESGADVLAIDEDPELIAIADAFSTQAVCADASDERVLQRLEIENFDTVIVCMAMNIEASIFITLACKQMGIKQIIVKAQNAKHREVLLKIGADSVIVPEEEMGEKLAHHLVKPNMIEVFNLTDNFRLIEIKTPLKWQNKTLKELDLRNEEKVSVMLIKRGEEVIVAPGGESMLLLGDTLVIAGGITETERISKKGS